MTKILALFNLLKERVFVRKQSVFLAWFLAAPTLLLGFSFTFIMHSHPASGVLFLLSIIALWSFWKANEKWSAIFFYGLIAFFLFGLFKWPQMQEGYARIWGWGLFLSVITTYLLQTEVREFFQNSEVRGYEAEKERDLWRSRFETSQEKHSRDLEEMEEKVKLAESSRAEMKTHVESLRRLIEVTQEEASSFAKEKYKLIEDLKEAGNKEPEAVYADSVDREEVLKMLDELNHYRTEHYQLQLIIEDFRKRLQKPDEPFQWQRWRGDEKEVEEPKASVAKAKITLQDLSKKL